MFILCKRLFYTLILSFILTGCGPVTSHYVKVEDYYALNQFNEAEKIIDENKNGYGDANAVLYYMDKGITAHLEGDFEKSNEYLTTAEDQIDLLFRKSIAEDIGSMLLNDNTYPYEGEDFEKVMINIIMVLNYVYLNKWDDALVEAKKVDHKLSLFNDKYEKQNTYKEDAFARYLSAILYETKGEINDALIEYRKAYEAFKIYKKYYHTPVLPYIGADLLRTTDALHFDEEFNKYKQEFPDVNWEPVKSLDKKGEVIIIAYGGKSPVKKDYFIDAVIPEEKKMKGIVRVAFPRFVPRTYEHINFNIDIIGINGKYKTYLIEDITAIAEKNLEDRIARISVKAIARAIAKYIAASQLRKEANKGGNPLVSGLTWLGTNIFSVASEQSDKRSWRTLPGEFQICRIPLEPGEYNLVIKPDGFSKGNLIKINVKAGEKKFIEVHSY